MDNKMTPAELAAMRLNKGKSTEELLEEAKKKDILKKMQSMPPPLPVKTGALPPGVSMSDESKEMMDATNAGYDYTKKQNMKKHGGSIKKMVKGGSVSSASKRADGIATKGKTRGRMV